VTLSVPDEPGDYELRYVQAKSGVTLVSAPLSVLPAIAELTIPASVVAGSAFEVRWQGPDRSQDQLVVASSEGEPGETLPWQYVDDGPPATLRAPDAAGTYEVRYVDGQAGSVLASAPLKVMGVTAQLNVPDSVPAGSAFEVTWEGPDNLHDQLAVAPDNREPDAKTLWKYTADGSPATLRAPDNAGVYEVRYLNGQSGGILASTRFEVTAVSAELQVPDSVPAGSEFDIRWTGPDNPQDLITIAAPGSDKGARISWKYTDSGSPMTLQAPEEPGQYELRYIMGHSGSILASQPFEVD
jgi:Ca-activated chloride channel family protein